MLDKDLKFDKSCHVLYSKLCKREILRKITLHYPKEERDAVWSRVQKQYVDYLSFWRTDLGGRKNFHNGNCGTYDCIALTAYYAVCRPVTSISEIEGMMANMLLPSFRILGRFVDSNKPFWRKLLYHAFLRAKKRCERWHDYEMSIAPYDKNKPIYYEFTTCPVAEFTKKCGMTEIMPALCNGDYDALSLLHARLVRTSTCVFGSKCDYTICGDKDPFLYEHPEYRDENGYRRNK